MTAPTSEERREVARKLRDDLPVARNIQEGYVATMQTIGVRPCLLMAEGQSGDRFDKTAYEEGAARLADLIDPTCHFLPSSDGGFGCDRCYTWFTSMKEKPRFCPECGARVVNS